MRVDLDHIHVLVLALGDLLTSDHITHVHDAVFVTLIRIVVKEDVLGVVVGLIDKQKLGSTIRETARLPARVIRRNGHGAVLFESLEVALELLQVVSDQVRLISVVDHVNVTEILRLVTLVLTTHLHDFINAVTGTVEGASLRWLLDSVIFLVLAAVHFDEGRSVATIEARVLS